MLIILPSLSVPIILGFRDIVKKMPHVFISHFAAAMSEAHTKELKQLSLALLDHSSTKTLTIVGSNKQYHQQIPTTVTILNINVNGFTSACSKGLLEYLHATSHDILALTEVKLTPTKHNDAKKILYQAGYKSASIFSTKGQAGVLIASKLEEDPVYVHGLPREEPDEQEARHISATYQQPRLTVCVPYVPFNNADLKNREEYLKHFNNLFMLNINDILKGAQARNRDVVIAGDMQVAMTNLDQTDNAKPDGAGSTQLERHQHAQLLQLGLRDAYRAQPTRPRLHGSLHVHWMGERQYQIYGRKENRSYIDQ